MRNRRGFTLVELLVVIAIIGILVALLLPAIQAAREAARRTQCKNHMKQIALGWMLHLDAHGFYPSGGWGYYWYSDPNRGYGKDQPGGWVFDILAYIEEGDLRELGLGLPVPSLAFQKASETLNSTPIGMFHCPTRRPPQVYLASNGGVYVQSFLTGLAQTRGIVKTDYAASAGSSRYWDGDPSWFWIPSNYNQADTSVAWTKTNRCRRPGPSNPDFEKCQNGISYYRSQVKVAMVSDGTSKTYMVGEKYLSVDAQGLSSTQPHFDWGDNQGMYCGFEWDNHRVSFEPRRTPYPNGTTQSPFPESRLGSTDDQAAEIYQPRRDTLGYSAYGAFGSAHSAGLNMAMCDGSVQTISYDIDPWTHRNLANRMDGEVGKID